MTRFVFIVITLVFAFPAMAAETYTLDKYHTSIIWFASHFGFSDAAGQFADFSGRIIIDEETPQASAVEVVIKPGSIMTGIPKFDTHLKSADFLNVEQYPEATFKSSSVDVIDKKHARLHGDFTLLGVTKPIVLNVTLNKIGTNPYNQKRTIGFDIETGFRRSDFGMNFGLPGIGNEVRILIKAEGILSEQMQPEK